VLSKELKKLVNGKSGNSRHLAPEPLLLPRIASRIPLEGLRFTASAAAVLSNAWTPYGWPALADATAQAIAVRYTELSDNRLYALCDKLPQLPLALIELDEAAGQRVDNIIGGERVSRLRAGLGDTDFYLREAVRRVFSEPDPAHSTDEMMTLIRDRSEFESPEIQRNLLAYFLPLAPPANHQWMIPILINVLGIYPGWNAATAASRVAGLLDQNVAEQVGASLDAIDSHWADHVRVLLAGDSAETEFEEVTRALPDDKLFESLLASEKEPVLLDKIVDRMMRGWVS